MSQNIRITIAQIHIENSDRVGNLRRIENAVILAKESKSDIILFPESAILGWINPEAPQLANTIPGCDSDFLCKLALNYKIFICIGLDEKEGDRLFDSAVLIDDHGQIILKHRKINVLPDLMSPPYAIGNDVNTADTRFGKIGVIICADSFKDDILQKMLAQKPDIMLIPYGWAAPENEWPQHGKKLENVVINVAKTLKCPVIGTDLVGEVAHGPWQGQIYGGQSVAVDKNGKVLKIGKDREPEISSVTIMLK
jgi:predicted amidohydrolase